VAFFFINRALGKNRLCAGDDVIAKIDNFLHDRRSESALRFASPRLSPRVRFRQGFFHELPPMLLAVPLVCLLSDSICFFDPEGSGSAGLTRVLQAWQSVEAWFHRFNAWFNARFPGLWSIVVAASIWHFSIDRLQHGSR
jgi:hypothetical protein